MLYSKIVRQWNSTVRVQQWQSEWKLKQWETVKQWMLSQDIMNVNDQLWKILIGRVKFSSGHSVPTHVVFLDHVVCVKIPNQVFRIWTFIYFQHFNIYLVCTIHIQYFPRTYWNILSLTTIFMKKQQHVLNPKVSFSIFSEKTTWLKPSNLLLI